MRNPRFHSLAFIASPNGANFKYGYSNQASIAIQHQFGNDVSLTLPSTSMVADDYIGRLT